MGKTSIQAVINWLVALGASSVLYVIPAISPDLSNSPTAAKYFSLLSCLPFFAGAVTLALIDNIRTNDEPLCRLTRLDGFVWIGTAYYFLNIACQGDNDPTRTIEAVALIIWYLGLRILFASDRIFRILRYLLLLTVGYEAVLGLIQCYGGSPSLHARYAATGSFYNPGPFGGFLALFLPIALFGILDDRPTRSPLERWTNGGLFFLILLVLPVTMSRTAWAAAAIGCTSVLVFRYRRTLHKFIIDHRRTCATVLIGLVLLIAVGSNAAWRMKRDSAEGRLLLWKITTKIIARHPLTGCGFGRFGGAYGERQADYFAETERSEREIFVAGAPEDAFNEYLQITAEGGCIGGILFVGIVVAGLRGLWQRKERTGGLFFGAISLLIFAIASYPFSLTEFTLTGLFFLAAASTGTKGIPLNRYAVLAFWICIPVPLAIFFQRHEMPREEAYREWHTDHQMYQMKLYEQVVRSEQVQYPLLRIDTRFLFEYGHALHFTGDYRHSNERLAEGATRSADPMFWNVMGNNYKALGDTKQAEDCYHQAYYRVPNRIYPLYLLARLYYDTGQQAKLATMCDRVLRFQEKVPSPATAEIKRQIESWKETIALP